MLMALPCAVASSPGGTQTPYRSHWATSVAQGQNHLSEAATAASPITIAPEVLAWPLQSAIIDQELQLTMVLAWVFEWVTTAIAKEYIDEVLEQVTQGHSVWMTRYRIKCLPVQTLICVVILPHPPPPPPPPLNLFPKVFCSVPCPYWTGMKNQGLGMFTDVHITNASAIENRCPNHFIEVLAALEVD